MLLNIFNIYADVDARSILQAETPGGTHFGTYHRPPDGHFFLWLKCHILEMWCWYFFRSIKALKLKKKKTD